MGKRGDAYLRTMLLHGARSVTYRATQRLDAESWLMKLTNRRNKNVAAVALANKTAPSVWALLARSRVSGWLRRCGLPFGFVNWMAPRTW